MIQGATNESILSTIIASYNSARWRLERQCILVANVIHIDHGVAFRSNGHVLVKAIQMETSILVIGAVYTGDGIVAGSLLGDGSDGSAHRACSCDGGSDKIVPIGIKILLPNQNGIICGGVGNPAGIDGDLVGQGLVKVVLGAAGGLIRHSFVREPAAKGIAVADHERVVGTGGLFGRIHELRRVVGSAFPVFIEDEPMAFRRVDTENHITDDGDGVIVLVHVARRIADDVGAALDDIPAFKMVGVILNGIAHVDGIALLGIGIIGAEGNLLLAKGNTVLVQIGDLVSLEEHGIVHHLCAIAGRRQHAGNSGPDIGYGQRRCGRCVVLIRRPAAEINAIGESARTGIIEDLLHVIAGFDIHLGDLGVVQANEPDQNAGVITGSHHGIDGEVVGRKGDGVASRRDAACHLMPFVVVIHIIDVDHARAYKRRIVKSNLDAFLIDRLPIAVIDRNIKCGKNTTVAHRSGGLLFGALLVVSL